MLSWQNVVETNLVLHVNLSATAKIMQYVVIWTGYALLVLVLQAGVDQTVMYVSNTPQACKSRDQLPHVLQARAD